MEVFLIKQDDVWEKTSQCPYFWDLSDPFTFEDRLVFASNKFNKQALFFRDGIYLETIFSLFTGELENF